MARVRFGDMVSEKCDTTVYYCSRIKGVLSLL